MADAIVILDSSDDDEDVEASRKISPSSTQLNSGKRKENCMKRKIESINDEVTESKRMLTAEDLTTSRNFSDSQRLSGALLPSLQTVETLTTPTATPPLQLLASPPRNPNAVKDADKRPIADLQSPKKAEKTVRRVKFTTILKDSDDAWQQQRQKKLGSLISVQSQEIEIAPINDSSEEVAIDSSITPVTDLKSLTPSKLVSNEVKLDSCTIAGTKEKRKPLEEKAPLEKEYEELISECRKADSSPDMEKLIETKLLKYYYSVHPDFVKSRGFRKNVCSTIERIRAEPGLVYYNLKTVVDELNVRRKSKDVVITNDESSTSAGGGTTTNKHTEEQIKKLNKALYILKKRISKLEEAEVDWEDDDSAYLQVERFKKRACQIYEKICDLTGESKNARRIVKKPIQFSGTLFPAFNKTLQAYINRTKEFPDFFDVLRMLEHCNRQYDLKLASFEVKRIAQEAFIKVGKTLQSRRKTDLYETVTHFTANSTDPATSDPKLLAKLKENEKTRTKISEVIEKYARVQDDPEAIEELQNAKKDQNSVENSEKNGRLNTDKKKNFFPSDDSDDNEDEEDEENIDVHVDKLTRDDTIDISDVDSDIDLNDGGGGGGEGDGDNNRVEGTETTETEEQLKVETKINEETPIVQDRGDVQLTVNNNIMRTKTNESNAVTIEALDTNAIESNPITISDGTGKNNDELITILPEKTKSIDTVTLGNVRQSNSVVSAKPLKTSSNSKNSTNPTKHRTIAEIVISDEE